MELQLFSEKHTVAVAERRELIVVDLTLHNVVRVTRARRGSDGLGDGANLVT
jgi:hypothetical protein